MILKGDLEARLRRFSSARRGLVNASLGLYLGGWAAGAGILGLLVLSGWIPSAWANVLLFFVLGSFLLVLLAVYVLKRARFRSPVDEAFRMEELARETNSRIVSALDFLAQGVDTPLTRRVIEQASQDVSVSYESRLDQSLVRHRRNCMAAMGVLFLLLGLSPWFGFARAYGNLRQSCETVWDRLFPVEYALDPAPGIYVRRLDESATVALRFLKRGSGTVTLVVESSRESPKRIPLSSDGNRLLSHVLSSDAEASITAHFEFGRRRTPDITFVFAAPPVLVNMQAELTYPAYTRLLPKTLEGVQERFIGLAGTRIRLDFTFSKDLESASLTWDDSQALPLDVVGRYASIVILHTQSRRGGLQVRDKHGFPLASPLPLVFEIQRDEKPIVIVPPHLKEDMPLLESAVPQFSLFGIRAQDDYGLTRCALKWRKSTVSSPDLVLDQGEVERLISPVKTKEILNFEKVLGGLSLKPGDKITFQVEAVDNCMPEKQTMLSRRFSLFVHQNELDRFSMEQIGFLEGGRGLRGDRIPPAARATSVKAPEGLRTSEKVANDFRGEVVARTSAAGVSGEYRKLELLYRKVLSDLSSQEGSQEKPSSAER